MDDNFTSQNNRYTTKISQADESTLGVAQELRRFAMNEYLDTRNKQVLIGTTDTVVDDDSPPDDLLLTNAVTENTVQDDIDKTRYLKETKSYVTINSASRNQESTTTNNQEGSLFSTGTSYYVIYPFAPYQLVTDEDGKPLEIEGEYYIVMSSTTNHIQFQLQDMTIETAPVQVLNPDYSETFDIFLPATGERLSLTELQSSLETNINLIAATGKPLDNSTDKDHMFSVIVTYNPVINPDRASVIVSCQDNFKYNLTFYSFGFIEAPAVAKPLPASEAAYTVQDPAIIYPYPSSYALDLNKAYTTVKAIRIISSEIPNTDTIINENNDHITFQLINKTLPSPTVENPFSQNIMTQEGNIDWNVYIPYGNYNLEQLVAQMELIINNMIFGEAGLSDIFTITGNQTTNVFEISVNDPYAFKWNFNADSTLYWRNLYDMLGFKDSYTKLYVTKFSNIVNIRKNGHTLQNPYKPIVLRKSNIIWLQLNNYETIYDTLTQNHYFCKFSLNNVEDGQFAIDSFTPNVHVFIDSPITVLRKVDVRMYDEVGLPYNFYGTDHSFTLEITHHIDRLMGVDISSRRGVNDKSSYI
jgi:hypothetical protein